MHWTTKTLLWGGGLALGAYPLLFAGVLALLMLSELGNEVPRQWEDLWRGKADATVIETRTRCSFREIHTNGARQRAVNVDVPCDRIEAEMAARTVRVQRLSPKNEVVISFDDAAGQHVEAVTWPGLLRLSGPVTPGMRVAISYDRDNPANRPRAARGTGALVAFAVMLMMAGVTAFEFWRWLRRRLDAASARLGWGRGQR